MKKRKKPPLSVTAVIQNPVAKFAHQFNKAAIFADKNHYCRNAKHRKQETSLIVLTRVIKVVSCVTLNLSGFSLASLYSLA